MQRVDRMRRQGPPTKTSIGAGVAPRVRRASVLRWVVLCGIAVTAAAPHAVADSAAAARAVIAPEDLAAQAFDQRLNELRVVMGVLALLAWRSGARSRREGRPWRHATARRVALGVLAALAFASNYNFFLVTGLARHELYHYYLGAKYSPELGYFRLYECSIEAMREQGVGLAADLDEITDLRSKRRRPVAEVLAGAKPCPPDFTPERWAQFRGDVGFFYRLLGQDGFTNAIRDHGYNPSPVWTLMGRPIASLVPADVPGLWRIARLDLWLLFGMLAVVGWGFGFEIVCLTAIAWGVCGHTRYQWTGDAFLRQAWLAAALASISLVKRGWAASGGALLALSSLERVFPVLFSAGWTLRAVRRFARERVVEPAFARFAGAGVAAALVLVLAGGVVSGRGVRAYQEFGENLRAMTEFTPLNGLGLRYLLQYTREAPPPELIAGAQTREQVIQRNKERVFGQRLWIHWIVLAAFGVLFWRATTPEPRGDEGARESERLQDWEAMALGAALIPVLTMPGSYYVGFVLAGALLAARRPAIGSALLALTTAFALSLVAAPQGPLSFVLSSAALLTFCAWVLMDLQSPPPSGGSSIERAERVVAAAGH